MPKTPLPSHVVGISALLAMLCLASQAADHSKESPQVAAVRHMNAVLKQKEFRKFYDELCHPHIKKQIEAEAFVQHLTSDSGHAIIMLFERIVSALDEAAGPDALMARSQEEADEFEFIVVKDRYQSGKQWHLELKLDSGKWKMMDTD